MVGEIFESYLPQIARIAYKFSTMVGENFEIHISQMAKNELKLCTMVGENFENYICLEWTKFQLFPADIG